MTKYIVFTLFMALILAACGKDERFTYAGCLYTADDGSKYIDVCR